MGFFERYILMPGIMLGLFSTACFVMLIFYDDVEKVIKKFKKRPSFRAAVYVRLGIYGVLFLLGLVVHFI